MVCFFELQKSDFICTIELVHTLFLYFFYFWVARQQWIEYIYTDEKKKEINKTKQEVISQKRTSSSMCFSLFGFKMIGNVPSVFLRWSKFQSSVFFGVLVKFIGSFSFYSLHLKALAVIFFFLIVCTAIGSTKDSNRLLMQCLCTVRTEKNPTQSFNQFETQLNLTKSRYSNHPVAKRKKRWYLFLAILFFSWSSFFFNRIYNDKLVFVLNDEFSSQTHSNTKF